MSAREVTIVVEPDPDVAAALEAACPGPVVRADDADRAMPSAPLPDGDTAVLVLGPSLALEHAEADASRWRDRDPRVGVILVRRRVDAEALGAALRSGARAVLAEHDLADLGRAITAARAACARLRLAAPGPDVAGGRVHTVFAAKGGVGKTTVATNLAAVLAGRGERVALVDLDVAFGDVAVSLDLVPRRTLADVARLMGGPGPDPEQLRAALTRHPSGVQVLAAPPDPVGAGAIDPAVVPVALGALRRGFDHVVVDTPPALDELVLAALDCTDTLVLVATLDVPALRSLRTALDTLDRLAFPRDRQRVLLNRADAEAGISMAEAVPALGCAVSGTLPSSRDVPAAVNRGALLAHRSPTHPFSRALAGFAAEHVPRLVPPPTPDAPAAPRVRRTWSPRGLLAEVRP